MDGSLHIQKGSICSMDFYSKEIINKEFHLLDFWPDPGNYTLRLECVNKNSLSGGHYLGIESVRLRDRRPRVHTYAHDKDKDWDRDKDEDEARDGAGSKVTLCHVPPGNPEARHTISVGRAAVKARQRRSSSPT